MTVFDNTVPLVVSLPHNDPQLAVAARQAGADALKTHINVTHSVSGTIFGTLSEERSHLERILEVGLPVGLMVGGAGRVSRSEVATANDMGFAFMDVYAAHAPAWYVDACAPAAAVVALAPDDPFLLATALTGLGVTAIEAAWTPLDEYGTPLPDHHIAAISRLADSIDVPVVVPSQHALTADDVSRLVSAGAGALLVGAVVTGDRADTLGKAVEMFAGALASTRASPPAVEDTSTLHTPSTHRTTQSSPFMRKDR